MSSWPSSTPSGKRLSKAAGKVFHSRRDFAKSQPRKTGGPKYLDHESIRTTQEYYASLEMGEEISGLWSAFRPVPHAAFAETPKLRGDSKA